MLKVATYFLSAALGLLMRAAALGLLMCATGPASAQQFDRLNDKSLQPELIRPLQWVSVPTSQAPSLPQAFIDDPSGWVFQSYTDQTVLPTSIDNDVWASFTLAATDSPQSWIVRIPRATIEKVSMLRLNADGLWQVQSAGMAVAPALWSLPTRSPAFEVVSRTVPLTYFIRFENHNQVTDRPFLMSPIEFASGSSGIGILIGVMFGMCSILVVLCIAANRLANDTVFLSLGAFVAAVLLTNLVLMGYGGWRLWPSSVYLNRAMQSTAPLLALAAGAWFCAQASYAKVTSTAVFGLLCFVVAISVAFAGGMLATAGGLSREWFNAWVAFGLMSVIGSLVWLCFKGQRWNWWLLSGLSPLAAAASSRLAYNYGWVSKVDTTLVASVFLTQAGLTWLFLALAWRSRSALLANERKTALESYDAVTGLMMASVVKVHLPRLLLRADRLKLNCGVMMLRWADIEKNINTLPASRRADALAMFGRLLQRVVRDIDTAAHFDEANFMVLIEGPVNRSALASTGTQIISACLRAAEKIGQTHMVNVFNVFNVHIAIWHASQQAAGADEVIALLSTRLDRMASGTQRSVQFVDIAFDDSVTESDQDASLRRKDVINKINAIEASPRLPPIVVTNNRKSSR